MDEAGFDERDLVRGCLIGEPESLRAFIERFQQNVFGLCFRMLGHRQDAEDVAQEVLVRGLRGLRNWDGQRPLLPWMLMIAANRCRTHHAQRTRRPQLGDYLDTFAGDSPAELSYDWGEELQLALEQVREEYRLCFVLYHQQELSLLEISRMLAVPEGTVKIWLFRCRRLLAAWLTQRGIVPEGAA